MSSFLKVSRLFLDEIAFPVLHLLAGATSGRGYLHSPPLIPQRLASCLAIKEMNPLSIRYSELRHDPHIYSRAHLGK
jgi:hypothetical protein